MGVKRPCVAYFSPLPPDRTGIADYSAELIPHLAELVDLTLFADGVSSWAGFPVFSPHTFRRLDFDLPLYHMGNSVWHEGIYQTAVRHAGLVVLHDLFLHHFMAERTLAQGETAGYTRAFGYEQGLAGVQHAWQVYGKQTEHGLFTHPLHQRLLDVSLGTLVHSHYVRDKLQTKHPVWVVPAHITPHVGQSLRGQLAWPSESVIVGSVGQVTESKQLGLALRAFKRAQAQTAVPLRYLIVGEIHPSVPLQDEIAALGLGDVVRVLGRVASLQTFVDWIHTLDVVVNLRHPTVGETSATALRGMAAGKPVLLFEQGWYAELPDHACIKLPVTDEDALARALQQLAEEPSIRQKIGQSAYAYIEQTHQPAHVAQAYADAIDHLLNKL